MSKFRIELWSRDGERKLKWKEHNQVKIGGRSKIEKMGIRFGWNSSDK